jgi:AraC-type DNA-binding domain-containing proteins
MRKNKSKEINIDMAYLTSLVGGANFNNEIMITVINRFNREILNSTNHYESPFRINYLTFVLIINGESEVTIDYIKHKFSSKMWAGISPANVISYSSTSSDFYCYCVMISKNFIEDTLIGKQPMSLGNYLNLRDNPGVQLSVQEMNVLKESLDRLYYYLKISEHNYKREIIQNSFYNFLLELGNIFAGKANLKVDMQALSRKDQLANQFMILLRDNVKVEHSLTFYSNKMCISTQYLSLLLKEVTGKRAKEWIDSYIMSEAKRLLRIPNTTIQTVSNELHFYDQASFSKFFKKNTGISPKKYQNGY